MKKRFRHIYLEITNICNLACPFCSKDLRHKEHMSFYDFQKYALMCKIYTDYLYLHIKGEPLLHPDFLAILEFLDSIGMKVKITTNGFFLKNYQHQLINSQNIVRMNISLQSLVTKSLDEVKVYLENLVNFLDEVSIKNSFSVSLRLWNDKDNVLVNDYNSYIKQYLEQHFKTPLIDSRCLAEHIYVSIEDEFTWPSDNLVENPESSRCLGGSTHIGILVNGDVVLCCLDSNGQAKLGSLKGNTLNDILEEPRNVKIINDLKNGKYHFEICQKCTYRNRFK